MLVVLVGCTDDPPPFLIPDAGMIERCTGTGLECVGDIELECATGETQSMRDCRDEGLSCITGRGCSLCLPGSISCDSGIPIFCNAAGDGWEIGDACEPGLQCSPRGCLDLCVDAESSESYIGCEYWPTPAINSQLEPDFDFAVVIANPQLVPARVVVERNGAEVDSVTIAPGELETIRLPWVDELKGGEIGTEASAFVENGAYRLQSDVPVTVYQFNPLQYRLDRDCADDDDIDGLCFSFTNDASLLLPTHVLTGSYIGLARPSMAINVPDLETTVGSPGFLTVTAVEDDTELEVTARAFVSASPDTVVPEMEPGDTATITMNQGDVVQLLSAIPTTDCPNWVDDPEAPPGSFQYCDSGPTFDLTGTELRATRPIAVLGGHNCTFVPFNRWACDHLEEALFPVEAWGRSVLVGTTHSIRGEPNLMRVVSAADGNLITVDPISTGPIALNRGAFFETPLTQHVHVTGTEPFAVVQFLVGQDYAGLGASGVRAIGDPSMSLAIPNEQFRSEYTFLAPTTYSTSYINVTATLGSSIFLNGRLLGELAPIGDSGAGVLTLEVGSGVHNLQSTSTFGVVVYGFGNYTSYMYPAGLDLRLIAPPI